MKNIRKDKMTTSYLKQICNWKYKGVYEIYDMPSLSKMIEKGYSITKEENADNYICYIKNDEVVFYTNIKKMDGNKIFMGVGLKPEYCGKGLGKDFIVDAIDEIKKKYPEYLIYLEVRSFNERAIKAYKKVGFVVKDKSYKLDHLGQKSEFVTMVLEK